MSKAFEEYRELEQQLVRTRWLHRGEESEAEDAILDAMDKVWARLSTNERKEADSVDVSDVVGPGLAVASYIDVDVFATGEAPPMALVALSIPEAA